MKIKKGVSKNDRKEYLGHVELLRDAYVELQSIRDAVHPKSIVSSMRKLNSHSAICVLSSMIQLVPSHVVKKLNYRSRHNIVELLNALRIVATIDRKKKKRQLALKAYQNLLAWKPAIDKPYVPINYGIGSFQPLKSYLRWR